MEAKHLRKQGSNNIGLMCKGAPYFRVRAAHLCTPPTLYAITGTVTLLLRSHADVLARSAQCVLEHPAWAAPRGQHHLSTSCPIMHKQRLAPPSRPPHALTLTPRNPRRCDAPTATYACSLTLPFRLHPCPPAAPPAPLPCPAPSPPPPAPASPAHLRSLQSCTRLVGTKSTPTCSSGSPSSSSSWLPKPRGPCHTSW